MTGFLEAARSMGGQQLVPFPHDINRESINREAVEQARPSRAHQIILTAAFGRMRGVPGSVPAPDAVGMPNLSAACAVAGPIVASMVLAVSIGSAIRLRAGQHIVSVRSVPHSVHHLTLLVQRRLLEKIAAESRQFKRVSVEVGLPSGDLLSSRVVPGTLPDSVARVDRRLTVFGLRTEVRAPGVVARPRCCGEHQAMRIGSRQAAEIGSIADAYAGHEKSHGVPLRSALLLAVLCHRQD